MHYTSEWNLKTQQKWDVKMKSENEHFWVGGSIFQKMLIFKLILMFIFEKWKKNKKQK